MVSIPQASDATSTARLTEAIVQLCFDAKNWDALNDNLVLLSKRRGQLKQVIVYRLILMYLH